MTKLIIGLAGPMGSGKGELTKILQGMGYEHITLSSMIREEARRRGLPEDRDTLVSIGNEMRTVGGAGVLAKKALEKIYSSSHDMWVVDGIRNPKEINELRDADNVKIIGVDADKEILITRILSRGRAGDLSSRSDIIEKMDREWGLGQSPEGQQLGKCMELVDKTIFNEGSLEEFERAFLDYYNEIRSKNNSAYKRPSKDEYYLDLARSVCRRGTCTKVEIGAVIIRDDQVVATGYCGAPRGTKSSQEHGFCLRKKLGIPSGHRYEMCRSVHAEQNAIINAARSGTSLLGGDMYIYGKIQGESDEQRLDAFPCFICKKMLINCGLNRVICSLKDGGYKVFKVVDWANEWRENDIIDDQFQYGEKTVDVGTDNLLNIGA